MKSEEMIRMKIVTTEDQVHLNKLQQIKKVCSFSCLFTSVYIIRYSVISFHLKF